MIASCLVNQLMYFFSDRTSTKFEQFKSDKHNNTMNIVTEIIWNSNVTTIAKGYARHADGCRGNSTSEMFFRVMIKNNYDFN